MLESVFSKVADLLACNFIKKRLQHRFFLANIAKFFSISTFKSICERLLLTGLYIWSNRKLNISVFLTHCFTTKPESIRSSFFSNNLLSFFKKQINKNHSELVNNWWKSNHKNIFLLIKIFQKTALKISLYTMYFTRLLGLK